MQTGVASTLISALVFSLHCLLQSSAFLLTCTGMCIWHLCCHFHPHLTREGSYMTEKMWILRASRSRKDTVCPQHKDIQRCPFTREKPAAVMHLQMLIQSKIAELYPDINLFFPNPFSEAVTHPSHRIVIKETKALRLEHSPRSITFVPSSLKFCH